MKKSLVLCLLILPLFFVNTATATSTTISVDPPSYTAEDIGETFQIDVILQNVTNLAGYEFQLAYDSAVLNATSVEYGGIFGSTYMPVISVINNTGGWLGYACMEMYDEPAFDGSGGLATITFEAIELGFCALDLYDTELGGPSNPPEHIAHDVIDGVVDVIPEFPLAIIMPLFLIVTLVAVILGKIVRSKKHRGIEELANMQAHI